MSGCRYDFSKHDFTFYARKSDAQIIETIPSFNIDVITTKSDGNRRSTPIEYVVLGIVPLLWGSYAPVVKELYTNVATPPPSVVFNMLSYVVSLFTLLSVSLLSQTNSQRNPTTETQTSDYQKLLAQGGLELGLLLFIGSTLQIVGIQSTSATKASFLVQLTTVIVPVLDTVLSNRRLKPQLWFASILSAVGVFLLSNGFESPSDTSVTNGDFLVLASAIFYSLHVIRLGRYAPYISAVSLAAAKSFVELLISLSVILFAVLIKNDTTYTSYFTNIFERSDDIGLIALTYTLLWNGVATTGSYTNSKYFHILFSNTYIRHTNFIKHVHTTHKLHLITQ